MADNLIQPVKGQNMDAFPGNLGDQSYSFALNARQESEDGGQFNITNESSNTLAVNFPIGYKVIGRLNMVEFGRTIYWIVNPDSGSCEIGYISNSDNGCVDTLNLTNPADTGQPVYGESSELSLVPCLSYTTIISDSCLNFSVLHPIHDAEYKITNKTQEIYWTDDYNPPRWFDLNNIPLLITGGLDCNLLSIFPNYAVPEISVEQVENTGSLKIGSYQFLVAYSNSTGATWSQYYSVTDPCPIWENKFSETLSFDTSKSIKILIQGLDTEYNYINIAVVKTINFTETFELAATLSYTGTSISYTYTGNDKTALPLTRNEIYYRSPYYSTAGTMTSQNRILFMGNLVTEPRVNYQSVATGIQPQWQTWRIPYNKFEAYNNGVNTANLKGYMRDEVYPFDIVIIEQNGHVSDRFPLVGRSPFSSDLTIVSNLDADNTQEDPCSPSATMLNWQVYNTATNTIFLGDPTDNCYIGPWEQGDFAYWESTELYPNNPTIWGGLANTPIRHFKFPDSTITHIHDNNPGNDIGFEHSIYPIGIVFDIQNIRLAIANSSLTQTQKDNIAAIRILRGNRRVNKSVQAKGMVYNVGSYQFQGQEFLYPNYPFNDTNPDVFLSTEALDPITGQYTSAAAPYSGQAIGARLNGFTGPDQQRYNFISPDTSFIRPSLSGYMKLETVEYGQANAHIVHVQNNPLYEIGTQAGVKMAVILALTTILSYKVDFVVGTTTTVNTGIDISFAGFLPAFTQAFDLISKLVPFEQYGYQYNAVGNYCQFVPVPNNGSKIRGMTTVGYIAPGIETVPGETAPVNNFQRESSVYARLTTTLPYPWTYGVPQDNSRFTFGSYQATTGIQLSEGQRIQRDISAYYVSLKRYVPDQYGEIHSYQAIDTGFTLVLDGSPLSTVFGGDTFINRFALKRKLPFFISNTVGDKDNTDVDYSLLGNVSYPTYYMSTAPIDPTIPSSTVALFTSAYTFLTSLVGILVTVATAGIVGYAIVAIAMFTLMGDVIATLGIKKVNLDRSHTSGFYIQGMMYLFCYGIPYFFVESDFNCDYRQATNGTYGDFFPNVGTDIPDNWLQEKNVSISRPEEFTYNRDLSKQNLEDVYTYLPEDWDPNNNSFIHTTRVIWSQPYSIEERMSNWLSYGANDYYDFSYNNGPLTSLKGIEQEKILARFEDNFAVYNAYITLETNVKSAISNPGNMFSTPPQEYSRTDIGYSGSQHHAFCSTSQGHFWVDAKRGCVFQLQGGVKDISRLGMSNWFKNNLPFNITTHFPSYVPDNAYNGAGIAMVWDNRFNRLFITKKDYIPLSPNIIWDGTNFYNGSSTITETETIIVPGSLTCCPDGYAYNTTRGLCVREEDETVPPIPCPNITETITITIPGGNIIQLCDPRYFCDASWTVAYSPVTQSWVSFYSFLPNFYVEQQEFFQSGIQCEDTTLWNHNLTNKSYQTFYNEFHPFIIEPVTKADLLSNVLTSVSYRMDVYRYENQYDYRYMKDITFDKAIIYSPTQTSGELDIHIQHKDNLLDGIFATQNLTSISIPISSLDNIWRLNKISDVTKDANSLIPLFNYECNNVHKKLNNIALDYNKPFSMLKRTRLKSDYFKVRLLNNSQARYKFIFKYLISKSTLMKR